MASHEESKKETEVPLLKEEKLDEMKYLSVTHQNVCDLHIKEIQDQLDKVSSQGQEMATTINESGMLMNLVYYSQFCSFLVHGMEPKIMF